MLVEELKKCKLKKEITITIRSEILSVESERKIIYKNCNGLIGKHIYMFRIVQPKKKIGFIKDPYKEFDKSNKPRVLGKTFNISRFNKNHDNTEYLYVGSSKTIKSRVEQHLGDGNKRTYSLDLCHWLPENIEMSLKILSINTPNQEAIEAIEQSYWDHLQPLFGKRSGQ